MFVPITRALAAIHGKERAKYLSDSKRKYLSEFAVSLCTARWLMTSASQLMSGGTMHEMNQEISDNCHIYLLCKVPSLSFSKESFSYSYDEGVVSGDLRYQINGEIKLIPFRAEFPLLDGATKLELSKYPHREIQTFNEKGEGLRHLPASSISFSQGMHLQNEDLGNLEVLYVGQAFGDGDRSAFDRLKSHSTFQKILANIQYESPDYEIYVLTFEYIPYRIISQMDGMTKGTISGDEDTERFLSILDNPLTEHQQICLAEAGLIRYFKPRYNEIYKESFPLQSHKILKSCYELDFSALIVEINTDELRYSLFSDQAKANSHHIANYDLVNHEDRWGFFHIHSKEGESARYTNVTSET